MSLAKKIEKRYTYSDYLTWADEERWEIIDGVAYNMSPAPGVKHQNVVGTFFTHLKQKLAGKPFRPFIAPTDVVLSEIDVVQPDIFVVCDEKKITEANIQGAPDLVVEVLSPATALKDKREKKVLYERSGVREYIIVNPLELYAERFLLKKGHYEGSEVFGPKEVLSLQSLDAVEVPLWEIFEVEGPEAEEEKKSPSPQSSPRSGEEG